MPRRIAILGAGANGASIGADLTRAGHDVVLIDQWPEHVAAIRQRGEQLAAVGDTRLKPLGDRHQCAAGAFGEALGALAVARDGLALRLRVGKF